MKSSFSSIPIFKTIEAYNFRINIPPPRYEDFDIRSFEKNMETVKLKMAPFRIKFFQIALLESGGGMVTADGQPYELSNFTLFFNLPNQIIYWDVPQDWKGYYICVDESFYTVRIDGLSALYDFPYFKDYTSGIHLTKEEAEMMLDIMKRIDYEYTNPTPYNKPIIKSLLSTVLSYCIRFFHRQEETIETSNKQSSISTRFKDLVHHHVSAMVSGINKSSMSISEIADQLAISPKHLSEVIKKETGETPTDYINHLLMKEAMKLLRSTDLQIKEIAHLLGFQDSSYFNRLFKKITSSTPARYRDLAT